MHMHYLKFRYLDSFNFRVRMSTHFAGTRVILEFIPNHTSNESEWFAASVARDPGFEDFYVWRDATYDENGERKEPNDWVSKILIPTGDFILILINTEI